MPQNDGGNVQAKDQRAKKAGFTSKWTKPVVIASPALEPLAKEVRKRLGEEEYPESAGPTVTLDYFKSKDPNVKFNWTRVVGRKIIFLFDTVDQSRFFEQLSLLQALQGFAVPDGEERHQVEDLCQCWGLLLGQGITYHGGSSVVSTMSDGTHQSLAPH